MTILTVYLDCIYEKQQIIPRKCLTMAKNNKKGFSQIGIQLAYEKILVCGWYMTILVYTWYVKVTRMTEIENSGIQTGICGNLV